MKIRRQLFSFVETTLENNLHKSLILPTWLVNVQSSHNALRWSSHVTIQLNIHITHLLSLTWILSSCNACSLWKHYSSSFRKHDERCYAVKYQNSPLKDCLQRWYQSYWKTLIGSWNSYLQVVHNGNRIKIGTNNAATEEFCNACHHRILWRKLYTLLCLCRPFIWAIALLWGVGQSLYKHLSNTPCKLMYKQEQATNTQQKQSELLGINM